jgi:peptide/nickel transport system permease protein
LEPTARSTEFVAPSSAGVVWRRFRREHVACAALVFFVARLRALLPAALPAHDPDAPRRALGEQYVVTARAKGAGNRRIVLRHALRNAVGPILPMVAADAGTALAVGELGGEFGHYDLPTIHGIVITVGLFVVLLSVLADLASGWLDPLVRTRVGTSGP